MKIRNLGDDKDYPNKPAVMAANSEKFPFEFGGTRKSLFLMLFPRKRAYALRTWQNGSHKFNLVELKPKSDRVSNAIAQCGSPRILQSNTSTYCNSPDSGGPKKITYPAGKPIDECSPNEPNPGISTDKDKMEPNIGGNQAKKTRGNP